MFFKATITFVIISLIVVILSIPLGILLSQRISAPYLRIFKNLSIMAQKRLKIDTTVNLAEDERKLLEKYMRVLMDDLHSLKEYEKVKSWKDGARMLMHEIKNPLTPLKLSAQSLTLSSEKSESAGEDVTRILTSVKDIETILSYFKELVNIEFGPLSAFDFFQHFHAFTDQVKPTLVFPCILPADAKPFVVLSEPTLLTMLFTNLIKNGLAENKLDFHVDVSEINDLLSMRFITPNAHIKDALKIFSLGYSTKGKDRGFGLFLCKKISDYLDLNIQCRQEQSAVVFSIDFKRCNTTEGHLSLNPLQAKAQTYDTL